MNIPVDPLGSPSRAGGGDKVFIFTNSIEFNPLIPVVTAIWGREIRRVPLTATGTTVYTPALNKNKCILYGTRLRLL